MSTIHLETKLATIPRPRGRLGYQTTAETVKRLQREAIQSLLDKGQHEMSELKWAEVCSDISELVRAVTELSDKKWEICRLEKMLAKQRQADERHFQRQHEFDIEKLKLEQAKVAGHAAG